MIQKLAYIISTAAAVAVSSSAALADSMIHDANSGLVTFYYDEPLCNLQRKGLPLNDSAKKWIKQHPESCVQTRRPY